MYKSKYVCVIMHMDVALCLFIPLFLNDLPNGNHRGGATPWLWSKVVGWDVALLAAGRVVKLITAVDNGCMKPLENERLIHL